MPTGAERDNGEAVKAITKLVIIIIANVLFPTESLPRHSIKVYRFLGNREVYLPLM